MKPVSLKLLLLALCIPLTFQSCEEDDTTDPTPPIIYPFKTTDFGVTILSDNLINENAVIEYRIINYTDSLYEIDTKNGGYFEILFKMVAKDNTDYGKYVTLPTIAAHDTLIKTVSVFVDSKEYVDLKSQVVFVKQ